MLSLSVIAVLQITPDEATTLLRAFKWNVNRVHDEWFQDESAVRARVGLSLAAQDAEPEYGDVATCRVCFEEFPPRKTPTRDATTTSARTAGGVIWIMPSARDHRA